jgi:hypothetical protein
MAAVSVRKVEGADSNRSTVKGCLFDIPHSELASYLEREHRYIPYQVEVTDMEVVIYMSK